MGAPARVIQIVPRLGPYDGIGDYALNLAGGLRERHGAMSSFVQAGVRQGHGDVAGFEVHRCAAGSGVALAAALGHAGAAGARVLLHYVGYGYANRGAPLWLARAIARAHRELRFRLVVVFHELYATGRPWQSSFWLAGLQRGIVARIARECDGALVTREDSRRWLERSGTLTGKSVAVLPVPSSVGEPAAVAAVDDRPASLVVWGSAAMKRVVYEARWVPVREACAALGVVRIIDVGVAAASYPRDSIPIERHGPLPAADISRILGTARFGLVAYPPAFLAKSSLFAAYAAHGMVPLVLDDSGSQAMDGLMEGRQFLVLPRSGPERAQRWLADVAGAARVWYARHVLSRHVDEVWRMLAGPRP